MNKKRFLRAGSSRAMLTNLGLQLWEEGRLDVSQLPEARGKPVETEERARAILMRSVAADVVPALADCLDDKEIVIEGRVAPRSRRVLERLGLPVQVERTEAERAEPRYVDMTPMVVVIAALVMGTRYLALGMNNTMLYVMAGLGYALFFVIRSFAFRWQRPRSQG